MNPTNEPQTPPTPQEPVAPPMQTSAPAPNPAPEPTPAPTLTPPSIPLDPPAAARPRGFFTGRLNRMGYFLGNVYLSLAALIVIAILMGVIFASHNNSIFSGLGVLIYIVLVVASSIIGIALSIRRLHDLNQTGWLTLLNFVPIANFVLAIALLFVPGTPGPNQYGDSAQPSLGVKDIFNL